MNYSPRATLAYARSAWELILRDRGMLIGDMILATIIPFIVQGILWIWLQPESSRNMLPIQTIFYFAYTITMGRLNNGYEVITQTSERVSSGSKYR